jgi:glycosyltransferase involved in cell wall biosynthesis
MDRCNSTDFSAAMRILLVSSSSGSRGGGELYLLNLARALAMHGHTVALWISEHPRMDELKDRFMAIGSVFRATYRNTYDHRFRCISTSCNGVATRLLTRQWLAWKPDVIHFNKQNLEDGLDLIATARKLPVPTVCTIHLTQSAEFLRARFSRIRDCIARRELRRYPGLFVSIQEQRATELRKLVGAPEKVSSIFNAIDIPDRAALRRWRTQTRRELGVDDESFLVLALGRMVPQKRPGLFLELAEVLLRSLPRARFLWIGDGVLAADWDSFVERSHLGAFIRRLPWQVEVFSLLAAGDLFLHVAEYEGLPMAVTEAMAALLPVALTPNLIHDIEYFRKRRDVCLEVSEGWEKHLKNANRLRAVAERGREAIEKDFSLTRMGALYESLYRRISRNAAPKSG